MDYVMRFCGRQPDVNENREILPSEIFDFSISVSDKKWEEII
jgi:hypothetical protein